MSARNNAISTLASPALMPLLASIASFHFAASLSLICFFFQSCPRRGAIVSSSLNRIALLSLMIAAVDGRGPATS